MRLLLELTSSCNAVYDLSYYNKVQGFIYKLIKDTPYNILHDKKGYKFFCFSNIFPIGDFKMGDRRRLLISSPDTFFIKLLEDKLKQYSGQINIGDLSFSIEAVKVIQPKITNNLRLITATPIILRIPKKNYEKYGIKSDKEYIYWQPDYPFETFIKQLEENIIKKYKEFYKNDIQEFPIFEQFVFKKSTVSHVFIDGQEYRFFGSIWEFKFNGLKYNKEKEDVLRFAIDCGLGERNTFGFGFVNVV